jgi:hypothetical protein
MKPLRVILPALLLAACALHAQAAVAVKAKTTAEATIVPTAAPTPEKLWKKEVVAKYSLNQSTFDNWAQGGDDTLSWQAGLYATFLRDGKRGAWKNNFKAVYGRAKTGGLPSNKTVDELFFETVYTFKMARWVNPFIAGTAQSQIDSGYTATTPRVETSRFLDPGFFTQSAGIAYDNKKGLTSRLGAAVKETITQLFPVPYADDPSTLELETTRIEPGVSSVTEYKHKLGPQTLFSTKLDVFSNLKAADQMSARWSNLLSVKAAKFLDMTAEMEVLFDGHVSQRRQLRQSLGLGLSYTLL